MTDKQPETRSGEFRRYRVGLAALYLAIAGLGVTLLVASVVRGLFFADPAQAANSAESRECVRDLTEALERMRAQIPAQMAKQLRGAPPTHEPSVAQLVARCSRETNSPANRAANRLVREAADAIGELDLGVRHLQIQFDRDVAAPVARADIALTRARAVLEMEGRSP